MTRRGYLRLSCSAVLLLATVSAVPVTPWLLWNVSASVPVGLYILRPIERPTVGTIVALTPPESLARFMVERGYIARGVPLLKRVAALAGQQVCRRARTITVDGVVLGDALDRDRAGRSLPRWEGCRRIAVDEVFLMNSTVGDSLDGRYFGPLPRDSLVAVARPLWTDDAGDGGFVWHAPAC